MFNIYYVILTWSRVNVTGDIAFSEDLFQGAEVWLCKTMKTSGMIDVLLFGAGHNKVQLNKGLEGTNSTEGHDAHTQDATDTPEMDRTYRFRSNPAL